MNTQIIVCPRWYKVVIGLSVAGVTIFAVLMPTVAVVKIGSPHMIFIGILGFLFCASLSVVGFIQIRHWNDRLEVRADRIVYKRGDGRAVELPWSEIEKVSITFSGWVVVRGRGGDVVIKITPLLDTEMVYAIINHRLSLYA